MKLTHNMKVSFLLYHHIRLIAIVNTKTEDNTIELDILNSDDYICLTLDYLKMSDFKDEK